MEKGPVTFKAKPDDGNGGFSEAKKPLEYETGSVEIITNFLDGVDSLTGKNVEDLSGEEKFGLINRTLQDLFRFYNNNSDSFNLHQKAIHSAYLVALSRIKQTESELNKKEVENTIESHIMGTIGHCLSHGFDGIKRLVPNKMGAEQLPESVKKIAEFTAKFYESLGSFTQAWEYYQYSYPDKYKEMVKAIETSHFNKEVIATYMHSDPDFQGKMEELKTTFLDLLKSIESEEFMQSDLLEETRRLSKDCLGLIGSQKS